MSEFLNSAAVTAAFEDCLYREGEATDGHVKVEGITATYGLHPGRVAAHKDVITKMLADLPNEFQADGGGGMSFLQACQDKNGEQWTGMHRVMEQLFVMGMAAGLVDCLMPRELWPALPGSMPYYVVKAAQVAA